MNTTTLDINMAIKQLKKLPFSKSWQNSYVSKSHKQIVNTENGAIEEKELEVFVYIPALTIMQIWMNDRDFLSFRQENKFSDEYNFKLLPDKTENNNRRLAIMYVAQFLREAEIEFLIDDKFTLYITGDELQKLHDSDQPAKKEFYNALYIPKHFGGRKGAEETWSH